MQFRAPAGCVPGQLPAHMALGATTQLQSMGLLVPGCGIASVAGSVALRGPTLNLASCRPLWHRAFQVSSSHGPCFTDERTKAEKGHHQVRVSLLVPHGGECVRQAVPPRTGRRPRSLSEDAAVRWGQCVCSWFQRRMGCDLHPPPPGAVTGGAGAGETVV